ncbi:Hypothetical predicted protein [Mytilus galloprovincialis]|uniref:Fibronectin type-III domain-containing protein n=1 Tax=Mytilus galloprovincialis TaxID=29158 RepID=A0A8B6CSH2_MYTGA|nr:Hypothetical predicted protein [Mytilus galloprovincialis]
MHKLNTLSKINIDATFEYHDRQLFKRYTEVGICDHNTRWFMFHIDGTALNFIFIFTVTDCKSTIPPKFNIKLGGLCTELNDHCSDTDAQCVDDGGGFFTCRCKSDFRQINGTCIHLIPIGGLCMGFKYLCEDINADCIADGGGVFTCQCKKTFQPSNDIPLYGECSHSNDTCADSDAVCIDEDDDPHGGEHNYMCQCKYDFIEIKGTCVKFIPVGDRCVGLEPLCADSNAHCVYDGGAGLKCKCRDPFTPSNGTCIQVVSTTTMKTTQPTTITLIPLGEFCYPGWSSGVCSDPNSRCLGSGEEVYFCSCISGYHGVNGTCVLNQDVTTMKTPPSTTVTLIPLDGFCYPDLSTGNCSDPNSRCEDGGEEIFICSCISGYHDINGTCVVVQAPVNPPKFSLDTVHATTSIQGRILYPQVFTNTAVTILVDGKSTSKIHIYGTYFSINHLSPGVCYTVQLALVVNSVSRRSEVHRGCTSPDAPNSLKLLQQTTAKIALNITKGLGHFDNFIVYMNGKQQGTIKNSTGSFIYYVINGLDAGMSYTIYVVAVANGLRSAASNSLQTHTNPFPPSKIVMVRHDHNSIDVNIFKSSGHADYYNVYLNDQKVKQLVVSTSTINTVLCHIDGLSPHTLYSIYVIAVSNGYNSTRSRELHIETDVAASNSQLSPGVIAGISVACIVGICFLLVISWFVIRPKILQKRSDQQILLGRYE